MPASREPYIALALSGGGAKAMAFHLGCMRVLHDRGILDQVKVISTVSGGSVIGAYWAYSSEDFEKFDQKMQVVLRHGIKWDILREVFSTWEGPKIVATIVLNGIPSFVLGLARLVVSLLHNWLGIPTGPVERLIDAIFGVLPVWGSLTTAFEAALRRHLFGEASLNQVRRPGVSTVINSCDLRTGTAFRFGSEKSGGWRYGVVAGQPQLVAKAVAASAAFPILLPPLVQTFSFDKNGAEHKETVSLTDGGVFENLGVSALEPNRSSGPIRSFPATHIISLNAGEGQFVGGGRHFWWVGRVARSFMAVHRKVQDAIYQRLHKYAETGELDAFGMVYLGQQDNKLPWAPTDLVRRDQVIDYPVDFSAMSEENLTLLIRRGEQLTNIIVDRYLPDLGK